ncbi:CBS domain-containing protein [Methanobacterium formicicum]|uniref:CBS domain-containing membrane protein n=1 Tax=Methanobacterium formicicum TaxID=2162 RepID=A0A0S4FRV4_METFO|nr:CBS domain-containing protein [Methanobacterium formicicum]CEL25741.1 CBS domain-containing membrane protein [Methanobacterium formicicum]
MHVKDIMAKGIVVVDKDQNIHDALKLMKKHKISRLPVINTNQNNQKELVGIITEKDIALRLGSSKYGNLAPSHFHVSTVMTPQPVIAQEDQTLASAAKTMLENKIGGLTVMDSGQITGMITKSDFLETCQGRPFTEITVKERMKTSVTTIGPQDRLVHARRIIIDQGIGHLPVMEDGHLQGMITAKDIALAMMSFRKVVPDKYKPARIRNLLVEDVMVQNVKTLTEETPVSQAAQMMLDANFSGMPVVEEEQMTGILTKTDFLELIVELEGF